AAAVYGGWGMEAVGGALGVRPVPGPGRWRSPRSAVVASGRTPYVPL
ncbi:MAG: hypothetical protein AVDCRST_MAG73-4049, partial [uncultured Thermomicrobiales bacterium]